MKRSAIQPISEVFLLKKINFSTIINVSYQGTNSGASLNYLQLIRFLSADTFRGTSESGVLR